MFGETERAIMGDVYRYLKAWYDRTITGDQWYDVIAQAGDLCGKYGSHPLAVHMICAVMLFLEEKSEKGEKNDCVYSASDAPD